MIRDITELTNTMEKMLIESAGVVATLSDDVYNIPCRSFNAGKVEVLSELLYLMTGKEY